MKQEPEHLLFFDDDCPLCVRAVRYIMTLDIDHKFLFAPLKGETAEEILGGPQTSLKKANSLVVVENWRSTDRDFWIRSQAIFRIYWLIGGQWKILGWLCFVPPFIGDFFYRWLSEHRHQFKMTPDREIGPEDRFLP